MLVQSVWLVPQNTRSPADSALSATGWPAVSYWSSETRAKPTPAPFCHEARANPEQLVANVVARYLDGEARFLAAVEKGIAAAERGEFIEEEEMDARVEAMFKP